MVEILGVIDREEGAAANIAAAGFHFRALFSRAQPGALMDVTLGTPWRASG